MPRTTQSESHSGVAANVISQFSEVQNQAKSVFATQKELLETLEQMNEHWITRAKSEAELATVLATKLASAHSMPDVTGVYQDWLSERVQRYVEDSNHVLAGVQKLIQAGARLAQNGHSDHLPGGRQQKHR
jgi:hypothetical protein